MVDMLAPTPPRTFPHPSRSASSADALQEPESSRRTAYTEDPLTAVQCLYSSQKNNVRERIIKAAKFTNLSGNFGVYLWEVTHPKWMNRFWEARKLARTTTIDELDLPHLKFRKRRIRGRVLDIVE
ncbi:hypothetical protein ABT269_26125 [Streptomyces viridosporus]|uniref:hypothetical protein n=1 Tax=Streptomyces viridosporus TaxID=67581 RepID=UPI003317589B